MRPTGWDGCCEQPNFVQTLGDDSTSRCTAHKDLGMVNINRGRPYCRLQPRLERRWAGSGSGAGSELKWRPLPHAVQQWQRQWAWTGKRAWTFEAHHNRRRLQRPAPHR